MLIARLLFCVIGASLLWSAGAGGACLSGTSGSCINFDSLPQISQQVVGKDRLAPSGKAWAADPDKPYTGPTVGVAPSLRRAPTVGYKWVFD